MRTRHEFDVTGWSMVYLPVIDHIVLANIDGMASVTEFGQQYPVRDAHAPQEDL